MEADTVLNQIKFFILSLLLLYNDSKRSSRSDDGDNIDNSDTNDNYNNNCILKLHRVIVDFGKVISMWVWRILLGLSGDYMIP